MVVNTIFMCDSISNRQVHCTVVFANRPTVIITFLNWLHQFSKRNIESKQAVCREQKYGCIALAPSITQISSIVTQTSG